MNLGLYSYFAAGLAYSFFGILLLFSLRESLQGKLLFLAIFVSACWAFIAAQISLHEESYLGLYQTFEILRYVVWYIFLFKLFDVAFSSAEQVEQEDSSNSYKKFTRWALPSSVCVAFLFLLLEWTSNVYLLPGIFAIGVAGSVVLSLIGLAIVEQLFRNTSPRYRWMTKYLFFGITGIFVFDFYLYTDALLFRTIDQNLWMTRGFVHLVAVPLLVIASARNKNWSLNIFVSRDIIFNTTAILGGGFYLLAMSVAGYYLRVFGGDWGEIAQVMFIVLAIVILFAVLSSSSLRAKAKVFLGKHFYKNKYDYRIEWLRLTDDLDDDDDNNHYKKVVEALANIVEARAGSLWLRDEIGEYTNISGWHDKRNHYRFAQDSSLVQFQIRTGFVINLREIESHKSQYKNLSLPEWLISDEQLWLIVPLHGQRDLLGFVILSNPLVERVINWEDRDLLKTAAKQVSNYLTVLMTSSQLAEAKQFEVFSRLSAFMVHDLKNIAAELELTAINARKHASNPEFVEDAFETVENAAGDINRLLTQLRDRRAVKEKKVQVDLLELVTEVVTLKQHLQPAPQLRIEAEEAQAVLEKARLSNVLAHLIENAQQATIAEGEIITTVSTMGYKAVIEIKDNGHGMDETFIRDRLFKPFDTTKGNAGMGIGMYESREFVRQLGGDIEVQSKPEKGTIITLYIPLAVSNNEI